MKYFLCFPLASKLMIAVLMSLILSACGGGGGGGSGSGSGGAVSDTTPPVVTLNGNNPASVFQFDSYTDAGASALDNTDGSVSVTTTGAVDTATLGSYTLTYSATDAAGNTGTATRTVDVIEDTIPPVITLSGDTPTTAFQFDSYVEAGASAVDNRDGSVSVIITGTVDTTVLGSYTLTYSATDAAGNTNATNRTVNVIADTAAPVITLNGETPTTVFQDAVYTEAGASAVDNRDGSVNVIITGAVNTATLGNYTLTYTATDAVGNTATATRTVNVILGPDTTPPVITLNGNSLVSIQQFSSYTEAGASALDNRDGTVNVIITGAVVTSTLGSYTLTYSATDAAGNTGTATRTVSVLSNGFVTTWKTNNPGVSTSTQVTIPTSGGGYNYEVDWGDGQVDSNVVGTITHTYATAGTYTVSITGDFPRIIFGAGTDARKLLTVERWGNITWSSMASAFNGCINLVVNASDSPNLSLVTDMSRMFFGATLFNKDIANWNVSTVTNMTSMFEGATAFNQPINNWTVTAVTNMASMFKNATLFNQPISSWDISAVTSVASMFEGASTFNQAINSWNVSAVTNMASMFKNATAFNQDISSWNVAAVTNMASMFEGATAFNQPINNWTVTAVTNMASMFKNAIIFNQAISSWDVSTVTSMASMFENAKAFNQAINNWTVSAVTNMASMFEGATAFNQAINSWDVSLVTNMSRMFRNAVAFRQDISNWNVALVSDMSFMFSENSTFNQNISSWNVASVTSMLGMFYNSPTFNQDISGWNVSLVKNMSFMFGDAKAFNQNIGGWNVSSVTDMMAMFYKANAFNQNISSWNVSLVKDISFMFWGATAFNQNIGSWNVTSVINAESMFNGSNLSTANYDMLLGGWSAQSLKSHVKFGAGSKQFSASSQPARDTLTNSFLWIVTDGGVAP